jgi:hypothetical protein
MARCNAHCVPRFRRSADFIEPSSGRRIADTLAGQNFPAGDLSNQPTQEQEDYPMLPTVIYLIEAIRRALKKSGRGVFMLVDVFGEAMEDWRKAKRKYPFAE